MIRIYHLKKTYASGALVFQDAYFAAPVSSWTVFTGGNRSGKTTLLKLLCGEETPASGLIQVDGKSVSGMDPEERSLFLKKVGLVFPDMGLLWDRTVEENLKLFLHFHEDFHREAKEKVFRLLERVGLKGKETKKPADLSFGEQRAVVLVRALSAQPSLLIADEPFQGLDESVIESFLALLEERRREGATLLLATQDPQPIARWVSKNPEVFVQWVQLKDRRILPSEVPPC